MKHVNVFDKTQQKTMRWIDSLLEGMGWTDRYRGYILLRGVLHTLRDRLPSDEAAQLGAQLPMLVRGFYYEGWHPAGTPKKYRHKDGFLAQVGREVPGLQDDELERAVTAVFNLLDNEMSAGELAQVRHAMPAEVRELWVIKAL